MHAAKTRLSELVAATESGEEVIIARGGTPAVRFVAVRIEHAPVRLRVFAGAIEIGARDPHRSSVDRCLSPLSVWEADRVAGRLRRRRG